MLYGDTSINVRAMVLFNALLEPAVHMTDVRIGNALQTDGYDMLVYAKLL